MRPFSQPEPLHLETADWAIEPLGDFLGATFGKPRHLVSERLIVAGGAYVCRFEMPFNSGAIIEIQNDSNRPIRDQTPYDALTPSKVSLNPD